MAEDITRETGIDSRTFTDELIKGTTYTRTINVRSNGINLSEYVGKMHWIDKGWDQQGATVVLSTDNNITPSNVNEDGTSANYIITIEPQETTERAINSFLYGDLQLDNGEGNKIIVCRIKVKIRGTAVRD